MDDHDINPSWFPVGGMTLIVRENIESVAIQILFGKGAIPMRVPPCDLVVHPFEFLDDDGKHDFDLIVTCPANLPDLREDDRLDWARGVCSKARTSQLRSYDPSRLVRALLGEESDG